MRKLEEELKKYVQSDFYPFHMPGHKRRGGPACALDITEIDGFDNLHDPRDLLLGEMEFAAAFYHTKETFFSVNGSTCGLLSAISAAVPRGGRLLIARGAHISVYHAAYLRDLEIGYLDGDCRFRSGGSCDDLRGRGLVPAGGDDRRVSGDGSGSRDCRGDDADAAPDAIVLTSPSYEGCVGDVAAWAEYAHRLGIPLIVDEAHGAHFSMHPYFPDSAVRLGADVVIQSTHKTLPAMTQTALLHNVTGRVSGAAIRRFLDIYESSSPSYVLLSSITSGIHLCAERGAALFEAYAARLRELRMKLSGLRQLQLLGGADAVLRDDAEFPPYTAGTRLDPGKIVIRGGNALGGPGLYDRLLRIYHLQPEMKAPDYVLLMTSVMDTDEGFARLEMALFDIDRSLDSKMTPGPEPEMSTGGPEMPGGTGMPGRTRMPDGTETHGETGTHDGTETHGGTGMPGGMGEALLRTKLFPPVKMRLADACDANSEPVPLSEAAGRIAADYVIVYPPDSPIIIPGEAFTGAVVQRIRALMEGGLSVTGVSGGCVRCVAVDIRYTTLLAN